MICKLTRVKHVGLLALLFPMLVCVPGIAQMPSSWQVVEMKETKGPIPGKNQIGVVVEVKDAEIQKKLQEGALPNHKFLLKS